MDIRAYLKSTERGSAVAIARRIGVSPVMVSQWAAGTKPVPVERCTDIEQATMRAVMRWDLRPDDWHRIWPELIAAEGAPAIQSAAEASDAR